MGRTPTDKPLPLSLHECTEDPDEMSVLKFLMRTDLERTETVMRIVRLHNPDDGAGMVRWHPPSASVPLCATCIVSSPAPSNCAGLSQVGHYDLELLHPG